MIHQLNKDSWSTYCAFCVVLCRGRVDMRRIRHVFFLRETALIGHRCHHLERRWWNCKDLPGLTWCDGGAVCFPVTGVLRCTEVGHTASQARYKVVVMFFTLTVRLQWTGEKTKRVLVSH